MTEPILEVKELVTQLRVNKELLTVVDGLSFSLYKGKTLAVVGESGSGKSMMALSLMRILPTPPALPSKGEVLYRGENLLALPEKKMRTIRGAKMAMIFQDPTAALNPLYTIGDQLLEVAYLHLNLSYEESFSLAIKTLNEVGITSAEKRIHDYPHQLSGGMRQRVMIAMALMCKPDILIADEPTTALDVTIQAQVLALIREIQKKEGMALLLITHDMGVVKAMADDVIVMYASRGVEKGAADEIFKEPLHPYTEGLFQSRPSFDTPKGEPLRAIRGTVPPLNCLPHGCPFHPRCSYKMKKCEEGAVSSFSPATPSHVAACWLWDGTEESKKRKKG